ncbi:MAG: hypothetical protein PHV62_07925, partial [Sulfuricurvum sp.]|nr:hypothetical protein [Sulfuricurvum sp.]
FDGKSLKVLDNNLGQGQQYIQSSISGNRMVNKGDSGAPAGSWPSSKAPVNQGDPAVEGRMPPPGTVWMVRPDGMQVPVHESNVAMAKSKYKFRGIND